MSKFKKILPYLHTYTLPTSDLTDSWIELLIKAWEENEFPERIYVPQVDEAFGPLFLDPMMRNYKYNAITDLNRIMVHIQDAEHNNRPDEVRSWDGIEEEEGWSLTSICYLTHPNEELKLIFEFPNASKAEVIIEPNVIYTVPSFVKYSLSKQTTSDRLVELNWGASVDSDLKHRITGDEW